MRHPTAPLSIGLALGLAVGVLGALAIALPSGAAQSREPDKTLKLYFGHTGERGEFKFKRNGRFDRGELKRINHFLRDWRRNEDAKMDPELLDLVWEIYRKSGSRDYIHIVSAYRSPATNEMLRSRSSGVAKNSQHRLGKAMDFYIPDVPLDKLRGVAMKMQGGGVGYYPRSGSPFVHVDTGSVRAWPRMSRKQLIALFPKGNTLHLPADGKPLPGYEQAVARGKPSSGTMLAYLDTGSSEPEVADRSGTNSDPNGWLKRIFRSKDGEEGEAEAEVAALETPTETEPEAATASILDSDLPRAPRARPDDSGDAVAIQVASIDQSIFDELPEPKTPRARPGEPADAGGPADASAAEDAIAALTASIDQAYPARSLFDADAKIALAFAAIEEEPPAPSEADRSILAAFSVLDASDVVRTADPELAAAVERRATGKPEPDEPAPIVVAAAEPSGGIVLAPDVAIAYAADEGTLVDLIEAPSGHEDDAEFAMPTPAPEFMTAPAAASDVADLRGQPGPPVNRFAGGAKPAFEDEGGFFTKLIASLIE